MWVCHCRLFVIGLISLELTFFFFFLPLDMPLPRIPCRDRRSIRCHKASLSMFEGLKGLVWNIPRIQCIPQSNRRIQVVLLTLKESSVKSHANVLYFSLKALTSFANAKVPQ